MPDHTWTLIAHGGAKDIEPQDEKANRAGLVTAVNIGGAILTNGGTALDAVEAVVIALENDPAYNAGQYGSVKNEEGKIELAASIMDGSTLDIGAVACITNAENPVSVAKQLLKDRAIFLAGEGAEKFVRAQGFAEPEKRLCAPANSPGCDTVGCVARDKHGNYAVATSTGGLEGVRAGRIGDVPLPGCGFYADNTRGAISCSGDGEFIARILLSSEFLHLLEETSANDAAIRAIKLLDRVNGEAGLIAIDSAGNTAWAHNSSHFAVGMAKEENAEPQIYLRKSEENAA